VEGLTPLFTPPDRFFVTDVTYAPPVVDLEAWTLRVHGMVDRELELSFDDLVGVGLVELDATLVCVHNPVGGPRIGSARWLGVPVGALLERAGVQRDAEQLVARSVDGFTAGVPIDDLTSRQAIIAVGMGGEPLPVDHGYPARLLVPGIWGADANTKWLTELELTSWAAVSDYWDTRGWPRRPTSVAPGSRIDVPGNRSTIVAGPTEIAGVAWAPRRGVTAVEVRVDDGPWQEAELSAELASTMWRQWRLEWTATPGAHELHVRTLSHRQTQHDQQQPPYPVGSRGKHRVSIDVRTAPPTTLRLLTSGARARWAALEERAKLGGAALPAWRARGYPPVPRWSAPSTSWGADDAGS
nr:molybdopterin-dependent oxidoreductase [Solirubrobacterales bacterium]